SRRLWRAGTASRASTAKLRHQRVDRVVLRQAAVLALDERRADGLAFLLLFEPPKRRAHDVARIAVTSACYFLGDEALEVLADDEASVLGHIHSPNKLLDGHYTKVW